MPSTYSPLLRTELLATGEQAGTWGIAVNTIHGTILEAAIAGTATVVLPAGAADYSLTALNGVADEARFAVLNITATITANRNVICPSLSKQYLVYNATSGAFTVTLKTLAGTGVVLPQGAYTSVYCDGTNVIGIDNIAAVHNATTKATAVDADEVGYWDSVTGLIRKMTWANIKTVLKAYFDALYVSKTSTTGSAILPAGTTAQRDASPIVGYARVNTTLGQLEAYIGAAWKGMVALTSNTIDFINVAGTFVSNFTNANTAARTYTFQDRNGTIADDSDLALKANLSSPALTGTPTAPTATAGTNTTQLATTAYVAAAVGGLGTAAGSVVYYAASTAPAGWLKANGAAISRTTYSILFAAIGTTYGTGDGSTTFNIPELRGEFIRSLADGRAVDTGRVLGSSQTDDFTSHNHPDTSTGSGVLGSISGNSWVQVNNSYTSTYTGGSAVSQGGTETRPRNVALLACIKY